MDTNRHESLVLDRGAHAARVPHSAASPNASAPIALIDLTLPQLAEAAHGLERLEKEYENMSGICATLKGLVFVEAKRRLGHGKFMPWVKENFKGSHRTGTAYMRLAEAFIDKLDSTFQFDVLTRDLAASLNRISEFQLDLSHPVVAKVAAWVKGRGAYQLMLDFPGSRGGDTSEHRKTLSPREEADQFLASAKEDFETALMSLDRIHDKRIWQAPSVTDSMLEQSVELAREFAREAAAWLRTPKRERAIPPAETFA